MYQGHPGKIMRGIKRMMGTLMRLFHIGMTFREATKACQGSDTNPGIINLQKPVEDGQADHRFRSGYLTTFRVIQ